MDISDGKSIEEMPLGLMFELMDKVEVEGNIQYCCRMCDFGRENNELNTFQAYRQRNPKNATYFQESQKRINKKEKPTFAPEKEYNESTTKHKKGGLFLWFTHCCNFEFEK